MNFDGLVGPTHFYGGLAQGNLASKRHKYQQSNPKEAALQGLEKMRYLYSLGIKQGFFPPHERPLLSEARKLGYFGTDMEIHSKLASEDEFLLSSLSSASYMWTANAATVTPSSDSLDGLLHLSPANLMSCYHRSVESEFTSKILKTVFSEVSGFKLHSALPKHENFSDEGAANHTRLYSKGGSGGIHLFVYGKSSRQSLELPKKFIARQSLEASQCMVRRHRIPEEACFLLQQTPEVIDLGVFHCDVIAVGNENTLFYHDDAFVNSDIMVEQIRNCFENKYNDTFHAIRVHRKQISVSKAVESYLFNSQLISLNSGKMLFLAPEQCREVKEVYEYLNGEFSKFPFIEKIEYMDLRQSMSNGGGPACLRLRVPLSDVELKKIHPAFIFNETTYAFLKDWIQRHYRDCVTIKDLKDPNLIRESRDALDELTQWMGVKAFYSFQT